MLIKALSQQTNLPAKTIRYYEEIGLLPPPRRLPNGYRDYDETAVARRLLCILFLWRPSLREQAERNKKLVIMKRFFWLATAVLLLALIGYTGYVAYPHFALSASANTSLLLLAAVAGVASLFSPCSLPLLLTLLGREAAVENGRLWRSAAAFTAGMVLFLLLIGFALALGAGQWIAAVTFTSAAGRLLRLAVGLALLGLGLWQARGKSLAFSWLNRALQPLWTKQAQLRRRQTTISYGLYGFGYTLAGFG